jgi:hypothetical protein
MFYKAIKNFFFRRVHKDKFKTQKTGEIIARNIAYHAGIIFCWKCNEKEAKAFLFFI